YYKKWDARNLAIILPGACIGTIAGWAAFDMFNDAGILLLVGLIASIFAINSFAKSKASTQQAREVSMSRGMFWSAVSGFTSFISHSGGPPIQVYLVPLKLEKEKFIATINVFFLLTHLFKTIPYAL